MDSGSKVLGWLGLIVGGALSIGANVRAIHLPDMPNADAGSYAVAVAPVVLAMIGIEQVSRWTHLPNGLRWGAVGIASLIAAAASWAHIVAVMLHYGQPAGIAYTFPIAVDGIMLLSSVALFVPFPDKAKPADTDTDTKPEPVRTSDAADTVVPERTDTPIRPEPEPVRTDKPAAAPRPRAPRPDPAWRGVAVRIMEQDPTLDNGKVAAKVMAEISGVWPSLEAGRKAVSRLRTAA